MQDLFPSPLSERATYQLPGAAFAERDGSYVNSRRSAAIGRAGPIRPPAGVRAEGSLYWELLGMPGLYNARRVLDEIAARDPVFRRGRRPGAGPLGVDLKVNLLAAAAAASTTVEKPEADVERLRSIGHR